MIPRPPYNVPGAGVPQSVGAFPGARPPNPYGIRPPLGGVQSAPPGSVGFAQRPPFPGSVGFGQRPPAPSFSAAANARKSHHLHAEEGTHFHEETENLEKQRKENDFSGEYGKRVYCHRHQTSMLPLLIIFIASGRWPFVWSVQADGTFHYKYKVARFMNIYFTFVTVVMGLVLILGLGNGIHIVLNVTISEWELTPSYQRQREYEEVLIRRYYVPLIYVYTSLIHACFATYLMIKKRDYVAHYYTFWSRAVYTMHMDVSRGGRTFSVKVLLVFIIGVITLCVLSAYHLGPTSKGLPTIFGDLTFRLLASEKDWIESKTKTRKTIQVLGALLLVFVFTGSKSTILAFIYHCKLLKSAFSYWNGRVYAAVLRGGEFAQTEEGRTTYKLLFRDHCILMDLMEGLDQVSAFSLESYFGCQIFSLFFELYFCIRTAKHGESRTEAAYPEKNQPAFFIRPYDWAPALLMVSLSVGLMYSASKSAASVAEEALAGLEVIRRRTMLGRKTDDELYFILSMFSSYTSYKRMEISGGGYSYMNKDFILGIISAVLSYFIILYQFQPVMDQPFSAGDPATREARMRFGKFLADIEHLEVDHYETTPFPGDLWGEFRVNATDVKRVTYG